MVTIKKFAATLEKGYQVASGQSENSPYPKGSIEMQLPHFKARGLCLTSFYLGTLNLSIYPHKFSIVKPDYHFKNIQWAKGFPPEDFLLVKCTLIHAEKSYQGLVYYPDPKTKIDHFQNESTLEVIAEFIDDISYGDSVYIELDVDKIRVV